MALKQWFFTWIKNDYEDNHFLISINDQINKIERAAHRAKVKPVPHGKIAKDDWNKAKDDIKKAIEASLLFERETMEQLNRPLATLLKRPRYPLIQLTETLLQSLTIMWQDFENAVERGDWPNHTRNGEELWRLCWSSQKATILLPDQTFGR
jgi:hypothetical protein